MSHKVIKRKDASKALQGLAQIQQLPDLLKQAQEVNKALMIENSRLNKEVSNILEEHDDRISKLERILTGIVTGTSKVEESNE